MSDSCLLYSRSGCDSLVRYGVVRFFIDGSDNLNNFSGIPSLWIAFIIRFWSTLSKAFPSLATVGGILAPLLLGFLAFVSG